MSPASPRSLVVTPLGGLGEIGMNCLVLEQSTLGLRERLVIDCGATFPLDDHGVELIHPRFDALLDAPDAIRGLVITHGHEDHIGAVPYLIDALACAGLGRLDIWGPSYALELCRDRLGDVGVDSARYELRPVAPGETITTGGFSFEPVRVTHSIVDATALIVGTHAGTVVHSGDFKLDADPFDGERTDEARLARAGDDGVELLLSDSTNVFQAGSSASERVAATALERVIAEARGRVVVGLFASNVHRLAALGAIARQLGRKLCLLGRSLRRHSEIARRLRHLQWPSDLLVAPELAATLPPERVLYLATGTQAEPRGALGRLAKGQLHDLRLARGDKVVLSSRIIPGAERAVHAMCDELLGLGVELTTRLDEPELHVSGHAHRGEQQRMIELVRPRCFIPLHGTRYHLHEHHKLARSLGVADAMVLVDGERAELGQDGLARLASVTSGRVAIAAGRPIDEEILRDRRAMARSGVVFVTLSWHSEHSAPDVRVSCAGLPDANAVSAAAIGATRAVATDLFHRDQSEVAQLVKRAVRQRVADKIGHRPSVEVKLVKGRGSE
jgi:ribonuclease J